MSKQGNVHKRHGKPKGQPRGQQGGGVRATMARAAATREQYATARQHEDITSRLVNDPVRRAAETYLTALEDRKGDAAAARSATVRALGALKELQTKGPVSPLELGQGITLAKELLKPRPTTA